MSENHSSFQSTISHQNISQDRHQANFGIKTPTSTPQEKLAGNDQNYSGELEHFFLLGQDLLCIAGFDGYFRRLNPAWSKTLGYSTEELLAKPYWEFIHPDDLSATMDEIQKLSQDHQTIDFQNRYLGQNGSYRWLSWNVTAVPEKQLLYCIARDITQNKQKEEELRESERHLKLAFEAASMGSWNWNIQTGIIKWSDNLEALFGLKPGEFDGSFEMFLSTIYPEDRDRVLKAIDNALKTGADYNLEFRMVYPNGQIRWALARGKVFYDPNGQPIKMTGIDLDITERKQLEQQLYRSIEHLSNLKFALDYSAIVAITNSQGIITEVNERFCQLSQYSRDELLGKDHRLINSGYHPPKFFKNLWSTITQGQVWRGEIKNKAKDGSYYWVDTTIVPFVDSCGKPWQYLAIRFDITNRKVAEEELQRNQERWQLALEGNNDGIWDWNIITNEVFFSRRWKEMLGYAESEIDNHLDEWSERVHPEDFENTMQAIQDHLAGKTEYYLNEHRLQSKDGSYHWILDRGKALFDAAGNPIRMVGSHTDITQKKQRENILRNLMEGVSAKTGKDFLQLLVKYLCQALNVQYAFISEISETTTDCQGKLKPISMTTVVGYGHGQFLENFSYELAHTPCENVFGNDVIVYPYGIQQLFPQDKELEIMGVESYVGVTLTNAQDQTFGLLSVLGTEPMLDTEWIREVIQIFAIRVSSELERQQTELHLKQQAQIIDQIHDAVISTDLEGKITSWNQGATRLFGYQREEMLDQYITVLHPPEEYEWLQTYLLPKLIEQGVHELELTQVKKSGEVFDAHLSLSLQRDASNQLVGIISYVMDISDRKRAENVEYQLKLALENAVEGIALVDSQGRYLKVNEAYGRICGHATEDLLGKYWQTIFVPKDLAKLELASQEMLQQGKAEIEIRGIKSENSLFFAQLVIVPANYDNRKSSGHYCFLKDITRRKEREARLRLLESVIVNTNDAIVITEAEPIHRPGPRIIYVNSAFEKMTGYSLAEVEGKTPRILQGEKTQRTELDKIRYALQNWQSLRIELINYRKDGSEFWVDNTITPVKDETGRYTHWVAVQRDITERKVVEERLRLQMSRSQLFTDISLKIRQSLQLEDILNSTTNEIQKLLDADRVLILRLETPKTLYAIQETVKPGWDSVIKQGFRDNCLDKEYLTKYPQGRVYRLDTDNLPDTHCLTGFLRQFQVKSKLVIPLVFQEKLWGMIVIHQCSQIRHWTDWEIDLLQQIANQIAIAIRKSQLVRTLDNFSTNLKHLHRINTTNYANFDDLFKDCLATGCEMFGLSTGVIGQITGQVYRIQAVQSSLEFLETGLEFNIKDTYCAPIVREKRTITYTRVGEMESMQDHPAYQNFQLESYIGTPIFVNGEIYGTLNFSSSQPRKNFQIQELEAIELMAQSIGKFITAYQTEMQRQQAELALRESEVRFRTMADSAPVLLWISDTDKQCSFLNQTWLKFTGRTFEQELGNGWTEGIHPHDLQYCLKTYETAFDLRQQFQIEYRLRRADGQYRWMLDTGMPRINPNGDFLGYIGSCIDISDRKESEEALGKQATQQAVIAQLGQFALGSTNLDSLMNLTMRALTHTLEVEYCKILELLPEDNQLLLRTGLGWKEGLVGRAKVSGKLNSQGGYTLLCSEPVIVSDLRTETRFQDSFLLQKHSIVSGMSAIIYAKDRPFGVLSVHSAEARTFCRDDINFLQAVANILSTAIEQKQAETALQKSEKRWATLTETAPVGIFLTDAQGNCNYVNQCWSQIAGMTIAEATAKGWANAIHPDDRERIFTEWYQATENNLPFAAEYRFIRPDGKITWVYGQAIAETTADGKVTGYIGTLTDMTERLQIERIQQALEREKKLSELKLRFFSMASHEFRTPLSIISFAAQVLENSEPEWLDTKKIRNIQRIKDSTHKITQILTDVLLLARAEATKLELKPKRFNLKQFCREVIEEIKTERKEDRIDFLYHGKDRQQVYLDAKILHSVLINLLSNAIKYSPQGGEVKFTVNLTAKSVELIIQDSGIGIPLADHSQLFEPFHRGENVNRIEGTGLGLAIVKRYVDLQGGTITFDSVPHQGTTFVVKIPLGNY